MVYREPQRLAVLLAIFCSILASVEPGVIVSLVLKKFNNKGRYAYDRWQTCGPFGSCNIYFKLCVKPSNYEPNDLSGCWYEINTRDKSHNAHSVDFKTVDTGIPKTLQIRKSKWPGSIGFYMEVWDRDWATGDDKLDVHSFWKRIPATANGSRPVTKDEVTCGRRPNTPVSSLTFSVQVKCELYYFGPKCDKYCKGASDASKGHYTCDGSGKHVCQSGWFNPPNCLTHCLPKDDKVNGHYTCDNDGTRSCRQGWYGKPKCNRYCVPQNSDSNGHYNCSKNGNRICVTGWTGKLCKRRVIPGLSSVMSTAYKSTRVFSSKVLLPSNFISFPQYSSSFLQRTSVMTHLGAVTTFTHETSGLSLTAAEPSSKHSSTSYGSSSTNLAQTLMMSTSPLQISVHVVRTILPASTVASYSSKSNMFTSVLSTFTVPSKPSTVLTDSKESSEIVSSRPTSLFQMPHGTSSISTAKIQTPKHTALMYSSFTYVPVSKTDAVSWSAHRNRNFSTKAITSLHPSQTPKLASTFDGVRSSAYSETKEYTKIGQKTVHIRTQTISVTHPSSYITGVYSRSFSVVHNSTPLPPKVNAEADADVFVWMMNTRKGNIVLAGFILALVFFIAFALAVCKIYKLKRSLVQRVSIKGVISPFDFDDENHIDGKRDQSFQMCSTACFGIVRKGGPQYSYQRQATEM